MVALRQDRLRTDLSARDNSGVHDDRLNDKHVAPLIKCTMLEADFRAGLPDIERLALFSGHSLRSGLASYAEGIVSG